MPTIEIPDIEIREIYIPDQFSFTMPTIHLIIGIDGPVTLGKP